MSAGLGRDGSLSAAGVWSAGSGLQNAHMQYPASLLNTANPEAAAGRFIKLSKIFELDKKLSKVHDKLSVWGEMNHSSHADGTATHRHLLIYKKHYLWWWLISVILTMADQGSQKTACNTCTDQQINSRYAHIRWLDFLILQQIRTSMTDTHTFLFNKTSNSDVAI